jgi:hypothetical protein
VVNRIITDLGVIDVTPQGLKVVELAEGVSREEIAAKTEAALDFPCWDKPVGVCSAGRSMLRPFSFSGARKCPEIAKKCLKCGFCIAIRRSSAESPALRKVRMRISA